MAAVGQPVWARDPRGDWYEAKVVAERDKDGSREVFIKFKGWGKRDQAWLAADSERLKDFGNGEWDWGRTTGRIDKGVYEVSHVIRRRLRSDGVAEAFVRWEGWDEADDAWVLEEDILDEELLEGVPVQKGTERQHAPRQPYTLGFIAQTPFFDDATADTMASEWLAMLGFQGARLLARQREAWAEKVVFDTKPCPPGLYVAMHRELRRMASSLPGAARRPGARACPSRGRDSRPVTPVGAGDDAAMVTDIVAVKGTKGGKFVEDKFTINSVGVVRNVISPFNFTGKGSVAHLKNGNAVMLAPPMYLHFRRTRIGVTYPSELHVTAHYVILHERLTTKGPVFTFDDKRARYSDGTRVALKRDFARTVLEFPKGVFNHSKKMKRELADISSFEFSA